MSFKLKDLPEDAINTKEIDSVFKYFASIDWSERWVHVLLTFHLALTLTILITRKKVRLQGVLFLLLLASVTLTERVNEWLAAHWRQISRQQYWDSRGMFISLSYSAPVLLNCVLILINWFFVSGDMLVKVKRRQLQGEGKVKENQEGTKVKEEETKKNK